MSETIGLLTFHPIEELSGHSVGYKYFDDDRNVYVSPEVYTQILNKKINDLRFVIMSYTKKQKPMKSIALEINEKIDQLMNGETLESVVNDLEVEQNRPNKAKLQINKHKMTEI